MRGGENMGEKHYLCIDLKSFYASVECRDRGLDPMITNLVVADEGRTEKTICLAVTPPLKAYGLSGRSRLFEVVSKIKEENSITEVIFHPTIDETKKNNYKEFLITQNPSFKDFLQNSGFSQSTFYDN